MTRSQADELSFPVVRAYMDAEDEILRMIAEQLAADGDLSDTSKWRIRQLARAGALDWKAIEIIKSYMPVVSDETDELITAAAMSEIAYTDAAFQRAAADGIKGIATEVPAEVTAFKVMKRFKKQAKHDLNLVNTVMGYETKKVYRKAVNEVYNAVHHDLGVGTASLISGQESLQAAVRSTIRRMSQTGIPGFVDKAGHEWSPEAYITMDLRTTAANTARQAQFDRCDDYGIDLIEVSSHMGARPLCAPYQGRIYSRGGASGSTKDGAGRTVYYSPLSQTSYGEPAGLFGINCGHQCYPFVPGANIQRYLPYDDEENAKAYEKSQVQRKLERDIRASKRECMMLDAAGDKEGYTKAAQKLKTRRENYKAYCKANDLGTQLERTQVYGFDRSQSSKATWAARKSSADKGLTNGAATTAPSVMHMVKPGMASSTLGGELSSGAGLTSAGGSGIIKPDKEYIFEAFTSKRHSDDIVDIVIEHHIGFKDISPAEMKDFLENSGYDVKPLGRKSSLKGILFENGGGYNIHFGGDAYFQYHPENKSHHKKQAYWRISNGKRGDNRYDLDGKEIP